MKPISESVDMQISRARPILLTGAHRSGTTWVGRILAAAPGVSLIYEPFNLRGRRAGVCAAPWRYWYEYICEENESSVLPALRDTLSFHYNTREEIKSLHSLRDLARLARDAARFGQARLARARPIVKDPIALFSAPWLASRFGMDVVVLIRHPAAFANSLRRRGWRFNFNNLLRQDLLMRSRLAAYRDEIRLFVDQEHDIIDQAGMLWKALYATVDGYRREHPDWHFVRHEDLSADPHAAFRSLFATLDLELSDRASKRLGALTTGTAGERPGDAVHWLQRDSSAVAHEWRSELNADQLDRLRDRVGDVYGSFYSDEDWGR